MIRIVTLEILQKNNQKRKVPEGTKMRLTQSGLVSNFSFLGYFSQYPTLVSSSIFPFAQREDKDFFVCGQGDRPRP